MSVCVWEGGERGGAARQQRVAITTRIRRAGRGTRGKHICAKPRLLPRGGGGSCLPPPPKTKNKQTHANACIWPPLNPPTHPPLLGTHLHGAVGSVADQVEDKVGQVVGLRGDMTRGMPATSTKAVVLVRPQWLGEQAQAHSRAHTPQNARVRARTHMSRPPPPRPPVPPATRTPRSAPAPAPSGRAGAPAGVRQHNGVVYQAD